VGTCDDGIDGDGDGRTDRGDVDAGGGADPLRSCDQVRAVARPAAPAPMRLACTVRRGDGTRIAGLRASPRECAIRGDLRARSPLTWLTKAAWRRWGQPEAFARAYVASTTKSGTRRVTVRAYRPRADCTGRYRVYTRIQIKAGSRTTIYKLTACATRRR